MVTSDHDAILGKLELQWEKQRAACRRLSKVKKGEKVKASKKRKSDLEKYQRQVLASSDKASILDGV